MSTTPDDEQIPDVEAADLEVGRFALRSFKYSVEFESQKIGQQIGWWTDRKSRVFRPIAYSRVDGWEDGTCEAVCHAHGARPRHQAPDEQCGCGIYGSLSYADVLHQFREEARHLLAVIAAEGVTIIGTRGLRTQFARVVAYWADPSGPGQTTNVQLWGGQRVTRCAPQQPTYREVAALQFKDAQAYDSPLEMVEEYGLPLLPPADADRRGSSIQNWWTSPPSPNPPAGLH